MAVRPLVLPITATTDGLQSAQRAMTAALDEIKDKGGELAETFERHFQELARNPGEAVGAMSKALSREIAQMQREAENAMSLGRDFDPTSGMSSATSRAMAENYSKIAQSMRDRAAATKQVVAAGELEEIQLQEIHKSALMVAAAYDEKARSMQQNADLYQRLETAQGQSSRSQTQSVIEAERANGQMRNGMQNLSYQIGDITKQFAAGQDPMQIFSQQGDQVIQALGQMSEGSSGLLGVLGGPWGAVIMGAVTILGTLAIEMGVFESATSKASKEAREHADTLNSVKDASNGVATAQSALGEMFDLTTGKLKEQNEVARLNVDLMMIKMRAEMAANEAMYKNSYQEFGQQSWQSVGGQIQQQAVVNGGGAIGFAMASVNALSTLNDANENRFTLKLKEVLEGKTDTDVAAKWAEKQDFTGVNGGLEKFLNTLTAISTNRLYAVTLNASERSLRTGTLDPSLRRDKPESNSRGSQRGDLADFAAPVNGAIGSGYGPRRRPTAGASTDHRGLDYSVAVGTPVRATQDGYIERAKLISGYGNRVEINHGAGTVSTYSHLSRFAVSPGQRVEKGDIIGYSGGARGAPGSGVSTGPHLHYEVIVNGVKVDPRKGKFRIDATSVQDKTDRAEDKAERDAKRKAAEEKQEAERKERSEAMYAEATYRADSELASQKKNGVEDPAQLLEMEKAAIDAARDRQRVETDRTAKAQKWSDADRDALQLKQQSVADAKKTSLDAKYEQQQQAKRLQGMDDGLALQAELLSLDGQFTPTLKEKLRIAQAVLEIERKRAMLAIDADLNEGRIDEAEADKRRIDTDQVYSRRGQNVSREHRSPTEQYRARLETSVGDINEALDGVKASGLQSLEDGLVGIISVTESVSSAFKRMAVSIIADLARIAIQKMILNAIGLSFGMPGLQTGGSLAGYAEGGLPGFAGGTRHANGMISGPGTGTSDSILAMVNGRRPILVSNEEGIVNARAVKRYWPLIDAMNKGTFPAFRDGGLLSGIAYPAIPSVAAMRGNAGSSAPIVFDMRGAVMTEHLLQQMQAISARHATIALAAAPGLAQQEMNEEHMQRIPM